MTNPSMGIEEYLDHCYGKFVQPLMKDLGLRLVDRRVDGMGEHYEFSGGNLMLRLVNDRGLVSLEIAPVSRPNDYWDLELVSGLFEPPPPGGVRRLNPEEQAQLLHTRWTDLSRRFGRARYLFTRRTLANLGGKRARALFGPGG